MPRSPRSPDRLRSERASCQSFCSRRVSTGSTSESTNSFVVWAMSRCSSLSFSGVKTSDAFVSSRIQEPPRKRGRGSCEEDTPARADSEGTVLINGLPGPLEPFEEAGGTHAASHAHCDQSVARVSPAHLVQQRRRQLCDGATEGMAERNRASVDVEAIGIDRQITQTGEYLCREGLVHLDEIDAIERQSRASQSLPHGWNRTDPKALRLDACGREGNESCHRLQPQGA